MILLCCSEVLFPHNFGALLISWIWILVKLELLPSPGKLTPFFRNIYLGNFILHVLIVLRIWEFLLIPNYNFTLTLIIFFLNVLSHWVSFVILLFHFRLLIDYCFYFPLFRPKLQYATVVWNSITSTDAKNLERIQRKFLALCYNRFLSRDSNGYSYANALRVLNLRTLHDRRHLLDAIFVINAFFGL
jgi:hypothetical protein